MIFVTRKRSSIELHVSRKAESIRRLFWLDYPGTVWRMKQSNLFYCRAVFFVSAYALHTVLRVPSGLRLEGIFVVRKNFGKQEQFRILTLFFIRERKIKVLSFRGFKNEGVFLYMVKDIRSYRKNWILFSTHGCIFPPLCPKKMRGFFKKFSDQG